jgi:5,6-dimethylbenzimidazole synthase
MDLASIACAIQKIWLAARAEGIGLGWVSFFDPKIQAQLLRAPDGAQPIAILCIVHVEKFLEKPLLESVAGINAVIYPKFHQKTPGDQYLGVGHY